MATPQSRKLNPSSSSSNAMQMSSLNSCIWFFDIRNYSIYYLDEGQMKAFPVDDVKKTTPFVLAFFFKGDEGSKWYSFSWNKYTKKIKTTFAPACEGFLEKTNTDPSTTPLQLFVGNHH